MMNYKYCIKEKLEALPISEYRHVRTQLPKVLGKTLRTFDRYCKIRANDCADIPAQDLDIIASLLNCEPNELKNYHVHNCKILHTVKRIGRGFKRRKE